MCSREEGAKKYFIPFFYLFFLFKGRNINKKIVSGINIEITNLKKSRSCNAFIYDLILSRIPPKKYEIAL